MRSDTISVDTVLTSLNESNVSCVFSSTLRWWVLDSIFGELLLIKILSTARSACSLLSNFAASIIAWFSALSSSDNCSSGPIAINHSSINEYHVLDNWLIIEFKSKIYNHLNPNDTYLVLEPLEEFVFV